MKIKKLDLAIIISILIIAVVLLACLSCVQSDNGPKLDPLVEAIAPVAVQLFVPEPWKTIAWVLLGSAVSGGTGGVIGRKTGKKKDD